MDMQDGIKRDPALVGKLRATFLKVILARRIKVSKFQNEFMKSSFLPKYEPKIVGISALSCSVAQYRAEILKIFSSYFGRNDDFINSF